MIKKRYKHLRTCMSTALLILLLVIAVDISGSSAKTFTPPESVVKSLPFSNQNNPEIEANQKVASQIQINEDQITNSQENDYQATEENNTDDSAQESNDATNNSQQEADLLDETPSTTPSEQTEATKEADTTITVVPTVAASTPNPTPTLGPTDRTTSCTDSDGTWRDFPNSCVDSCGLTVDPTLMCLQVVTEGCDCGPDSCWNGNSCIDNPNNFGGITPPVKNPTPIAE